ncbi:hypothetical protein DFP93_101237 [Aneurinibacillus soli]|uniref:Uncharacterized protein n=1 Tax=Aneurinibacillus soli TaxID=1500254 RepID=A0A0U5AWP8_9BACL|nr:hypothetical protein [Aneurinibacillus soli]PYE64212.1 hypothetical protein DFP93_101237 [Aneurinibacillus soli]BAU28161.1 hypothetical protein CB4_02335 [Aneurinibacillus soli]
MFLNSVISYLDAWEKLNKKYPEEFIDIIKSVENINLADYMALEEPHYKNIRRFINKLDFNLQTYGWLESKRYPHIGIIKNMVAVTTASGSTQTFTSWLFKRSNLAVKETVCEIPILIVLTKESTNKIFGGPNPIAYFENSARELEDLSPLSINYPFLILGISEYETPLQVTNIPSIIEGFDNKVVINRSIEFPPEYYQAGLGILSYFNKILQEKYPNTPATVKIIQDGLVVKMIIESEDGNKHIIEQALEEYELVVKGEIKPEEYFASATQILELKNELRIAKLRIENQNDILTFQKNQIDKLLDIISNGLAKPALPPTIHVSPVITVETSLSQQNNIHNELSNIIETIKSLSGLLNSPHDIELLDEIKDDLSETDVSHLKDSPSIPKLQKFLENINNAESNVSKSITTANEGIELVKKLAKHYNTIASWCALPQIPFVK